MGCDQLSLQKEPYAVMHVVTLATDLSAVLLGECSRETNISIVFEEEEQDKSIYNDSFSLSKSLTLKVNSSSTYLRWGLDFGNCCRCQG